MYLATSPDVLVRCADFRTLALKWRMCGYPDKPGSLPVEYVSGYRKPPMKGAFLRAERAGEELDSEGGGLGSEAYKRSIRYILSVCQVGC